MVIRFRLAGHTLRTIVTLMEKWSERENIPLPKNYDSRKVFLDIDRELQKIDRQDETIKQQLFELENERIDNLQVSLWDEAIKGNERKVDRILKILDRRAKYWGLDAPVKNELSGNIGINFERLRIMLAEDQDEEDESQG